MFLARIALLLAVSLPLAAAAQLPPAARTLDFRFTPAARTQIALWIERPDGTFLKTVKLTQAVSRRGIGNRPGAAQMNSGFRWPYGRREGVLPVWAHRRAAAPGAAQFPRVIFQNRRSEGCASITTADSSPDGYFCLSFDTATTKKEALDAISCASAFSSDKGRFLCGPEDVKAGRCLVDDLEAGYAEPAVVANQQIMRPLSLFSVYPPRRDVEPFGLDHADVGRYAGVVREVMPDIDSVTMATPPSEAEQSILFTVPEEWNDGEYVAWIEVNVEGDYNDTFNDRIYPTDTDPTIDCDRWDSWAEGSGYPYRGQPSVVYRQAFTLGASAAAGTVTPIGYGDLNGFGPMAGHLYPMMAGVITDGPDDPATRGSGADRLRLVAGKGYRFQVVVRSREQCLLDIVPKMPVNVSAAPVDDKKNSHHWGKLRFQVPATEGAIAHYEVRYAATEIRPDDPGSFERALPAVAAMIETQALTVPTNFGPGVEVEVDFGGMDPLTHYWVAIRAVDVCNVAGPFAVAELTTTQINFTRLSGCFIATAAYGSALEPEVAALRSVRDALRPRSALFAAATDLYYRSAPAASAVIAGSEVTRAAVRTLLGPVVELAAAAVRRGQ
jgi:hypothetical protein